MNALKFVEWLREQHVSDNITVVECPQQPHPLSSGLIKITCKRSITFPDNLNLLGLHLHITCMHGVIVRMGESLRLTRMTVDSSSEVVLGSGMFCYMLDVSDCIWVTHIPTDIVAHVINISRSGVSVIPKGNRAGVWDIRGCTLREVPADIQTNLIVYNQENLTIPEGVVADFKS